MVTPAQAGAQRQLSPEILDSRLRGNDISNSALHLFQELLGAVAGRCPIWSSLSSQL
jgi:hypothetical protein